MLQTAITQKQVLRRAPNNLAARVISATTSAISAFRESIAAIDFDALNADSNNYYQSGTRDGNFYSPYRF